MATKIRPLTKQQQEQQQNSNSPQKRERYNKNEDLELTPITHQNQLTDEQNQSQIENQIIHDEEMVNQMLDDLSDENKSSIVAGIDFREDGIIQNGPGNSKTGDKQRFKTIDKTSELQIGVMSSTCKTSANFKDALVQNQYSKVNRDSVIDPKGSSQNLNFMSTQKFLKDQYEEVNEDSSYSSRPFGKASSDLVKHQDSSNNRDSSRGAIIQEHYFEEQNQLSLLQSQNQQSAELLGARKSSSNNGINSNMGGRLMENAIGTNLMKKMVNISEYTVDFHLSNFIKLFLYHLVFFFFGPVILIIVPIFDSFAMARNMLFYGNGALPFFVYWQYFQWLCIATMTFMQAARYFQIEIAGHKITLEGIYYDQWIIVCMTVVIRSFIIAVRYGFSSELRFKVLRSSRADANYISKDLLGASWINTHPDTLEPEIDSVFWRNQVEEFNFNMKFYEKLDDCTYEKFHNEDYYKNPDNKFDMKKTQKLFKNYEARLKEKQKMTKMFNPFEEDYEMFSLHSIKTSFIEGVVQQKPSIGRLVFKELCIFAGAHTFSIAKFLMIAPTLKCLLPYIVRTYQYGNPFGPNMGTTEFYVYCFAEIPLMYYLTSVNYLFIGAGLIDFQRRYLMMKGIGSLINPFKQNLSLKQYQIFPTILLACKDSFHSWLNLRMCAMDFGKKYMMRIFVYCSTFLAGYTFIVIILLLDYFDFINFQLPLMLQVYCLYEVFIVLGVILTMLFIGAKVNQQYVEDRASLMKIRQTMLYIKLNIAQVRSGTKFSGPYMKVLQKTFSGAADHMTEQESCDYVDLLVSEVDNMLLRLEFDEEHQPLKLMGLKASFQLMNQIYTTLFTIAFAISQKMLT
eukprot:403371064